MVDNVILPFGEPFPEYTITKRIPDSREDLQLYAATDDQGRAVRLTCSVPDPLRPDLPSEKQFQRRLERLRSIQDPVLQPILGGGIRGKVRWVAMEDIPRDALSFRESIGFGLFPNQILRIIAVLAKTLSVAAEARIYHGDLCPELIATLCGDDDVVRLFELGFVQLFGERLDREPIYRSPEQIRGELPSELSDMYSLGMIAYEAFARRPAFSDKNGSMPDAAKLALLHLEKSPPPLRGGVHEFFHAGISLFVARLTEPKPDERFPTYQALIDAANETFQGYMVWRNHHNRMGELGRPVFKAILQRVREQPFTGASSGHRYSEIFNQGAAGVAPPTGRDPESELGADDEPSQEPRSGRAVAPEADARPVDAQKTDAEAPPAAPSGIVSPAHPRATIDAAPTRADAISENAPNGDPWLNPGSKLDEFTITKVLEPLGRVERYLAASDNRKRVVITCAKQSAMSPSDAEAQRILSLLRKLQPVGCAAVIGGRFEEGYAWVAREHASDSVLVWDILTGAARGSEGLATFGQALQDGVRQGRFMLAFSVALGVARALEAFAAEGIVHGALDPRTTLAFAPNGSPLILDVGYRQLFGADLEASAPEDSDFRAPEQRAGGEPNLRSDIYTLGAIVYWMLSGTTPESKGAPRLVEIIDPSYERISAIVEKALERDPALRFSTWRAFYEPLMPFLGGLMAVWVDSASSSSSSSAVSGAALQGSLKAAGPPLDERGADTDPCDLPAAADKSTEEAAPAAAPTTRVPVAPAWMRDAPAPAPAPEEPHVAAPAPLGATVMAGDVAPAHIEGAAAAPELGREDAHDAADPGLQDRPQALAAPPATTAPLATTAPPATSRRGRVGAILATFALALLIALFVRGSGAPTTRALLIGPVLPRSVPTLLPIESVEPVTPVTHDTTETHAPTSVTPTVIARRKRPCAPFLRCTLDPAGKISSKP